MHQQAALPKRVQILTLLARDHPFGRSRRAGRGRYAKTGAARSVQEECRGLTMEMHKDQYPIVAARRQGYDALLWQTPALAVTAQAFLLTVVFSPGANEHVAVVISAFALLVGLAAIQLLARLRYLEMYDSELLVTYEKSHETEGLAIVHGKRRPLASVPAKGLARFRAYRVWMAVLVAFLAVDGFGLLSAVTRAWPTTLVAQ